MNKPKFRAWDKVNKKMISWNRLLNGHNLRNVFMRPEMCGLILMQYTGLKDKNGVEACQGNYLKREDRWTFFIEWLDEYGCLMAVPVNLIQRINWEPVPVKRMLETGFVNDGNIHENPELLNEVE